MCIRDRIEPACRPPQGFRHAAACLPETYLAKLPPEQELVHEQIGEQDVYKRQVVPESDGR